MPLDLENNGSLGGKISDAEYNRLVDEFYKKLSYNQNSEVQKVLKLDGGRMF